MPSPNSAGTALFAYGSLIFPEVWMHVVGRQRPSAEASLAGHLAFTVRGYSFPGMVPTSIADSTPGRIYFNLEAEDWRQLDAFEDTFYQRIGVAVITTDGERHIANAYTVMPEHSGFLSDTVWTAEWFAENALGDFLDRICGFDPTG